MAAKRKIRELFATSRAGAEAGARGAISPAPTAECVLTRVHELADPLVAKTSAWYFKTGPGQYGEGDIFVGIRVPKLRVVVKEHRSLSLDEAVRLLQSEIHEARLVALLILVERAKKADRSVRRDLYDAYLANTHRVNNWDLVDASAPQIVGAYLAGCSRRPLHRLACSKSLWERRIAIIATYHFIRDDDYADTLAIAERLLADREDLIHKATGWMLREVGKRDAAALEAFLAMHAAHMPRTMLRYAIERMDEAKRRAYLRA